MLKVTTPMWVRSEEKRMPAEKKETKKRGRRKKYYQGIGRRKRSTAIVRLYEGKGPLLVNDKSIEEYFYGEKEALTYLAPFKATMQMNRFNGTVKVIGGGKVGQLGAVALGMARALLVYNPDLRSTLRKKGLLTRDPREKERKKYNLHKARRAHQYSKR